MMFLVFVITVALDIIWVWSFMALEGDDIAQSIAASVLSAGLVCLSTVLYVQDNMFIIPELIGNGVGVAVAMIIRRYIRLFEMLKGKNAD